MTSQILDSKGRPIKAITTPTIGAVLSSLEADFEPTGRKIGYGFNDYEMTYRAGPVCIRTYKGSEQLCNVLIVKDNRGNVVQGPYAIPIGQNKQSSVKK